MAEDNIKDAVENTADENTEETKENIEEIKTEEQTENNENNKEAPKTPDKKKTKKKKPKPPKKASNLKKIKAFSPNRKKIKKFVSKNRTAIIALVAVVVLLVIAFVFNSNNIIKIGEDQVNFSKDYSMSSRADFYVYNENIFYVSKDGMLFLDNKGNTLWSDTFTMSAPYMLCDGGYAAVADSNSKTVNVYDRTGRIYQIATAGPITTFAVNPIGCCAVVCKVGDDYRIDLYSNTGETMFEGARASKDGIPLGIDISDDGSIVSMTVVDYNDIKLKSSILFYYTRKSEADNTDSSDGLASGIEVEDAIAAVVKFLPGNKCIAASDKSFMNIDCSKANSCTKEWEKSFDNYVTAFDIVDNKYIAIAYGEPLDIANEEAVANENTIHWYNLNGRETGSAKTEDRITALSTSKDGTIAVSDKTFTAYTNRGKELWSYTAVQNVTDMQFYDSDDRVILITPTQMQVLNVKKGVAMEEEQISEETTTTQATTQAAAAEAETQTQ